MHQLDSTDNHSNTLICSKNMHLIDLMLQHKNNNLTI